MFRAMGSLEPSDTDTSILTNLIVDIYVIVKVNFDRSSAWRRNFIACEKNNQISRSIDDVIQNHSCHRK